MTRKTAAALAFLLMSLHCVPTARAQEPEHPSCELTLRDGSRLYGTIQSQTDETIVFRTIGGVIVTVQPIEVASVRQVTGSVVDGEFRPDDPNRTRLFFAPTARSLPRGQVYFGTYQVLLPFVQVGVTDRFSFGGGTPLMFGFDESERPFWITPKLQIIDMGRTQVAVGAIHAFDIHGDGGGIAYGVVSTGDSNGGLTVGAGLAYAGEGERGGLVMIGGERRLGRHSKFITENYLWRGGDGLLTGGVRFFGERLSADFGLLVPIGASDMFAFPIVNFMYLSERQRYSTRSA